MIRTILYHDDARKALEAGMDILSKTVSVTIGPKGKNVVLESKFGVPQIVNDGVTIAKEIELRDLLRNTGVALIRQAALKTNDVAGDGTTTTIVLAHAIVKEGIKSISTGSNVILIKKGIEKAVKFSVAKIAEYSRPVKDIDDIVSVASISAGNNLEVGHLIAKAIQKVGREGIISLEEGQSIKTYLEVVEGMRFNKGFMSPYLASNALKMESIQDDPYILLVDKTIALIQQELIPILEQVAETGRPLLIIAEDIEKEVLATIILNKIKGVLDVVAVKAPGFGDRRKAFLEDLAILTGAQVISSELGENLETISLDAMGSARRVIVTKNCTTIVSCGNQNFVKLRCDEIRKQIESSNNNYEKEKLQERLSKLSGGVAIIKLGAATEAEMRDKKLRLEDAISATRASIDEGIVPGGGSILVHLSQELNTWANQNLSHDELIGALIVKNALRAPLSKIVHNAGCNETVIIEKIQNTCFSIGYNADKGIIADMYTAGILDPAKVTRSALQNAASIASMILTTECII